MNMRVDRPSDVLFCCGAPESGKSHRIKLELEQRAPDRLVVIDPDGEYPDWGYLHTDPLDVARAMCYATFRTRFKPSPARASAERQFDLICRLVRWQTDPESGMGSPARLAPVCLVVDELADFVGSSFRETPESWQWVIRRGRKYGVSVLAASQRPAQIDKTITDLCSCIRVGRLGNAASVAWCADALDVPKDELRALVGIQFIERDKRTGVITRGPSSTPGDRARARGAAEVPSMVEQRRKGKKAKTSRSIDRS